MLYLVCSFDEHGYCSYDMEVQVVHDIWTLIFTVGYVGRV